MHHSFGARFLSFTQSLLTATAFSALVASSAAAETTFLVQLGLYGSESSSKQKWEELKSTYETALGELTPVHRGIQLPPAGNTQYRLQAGPVSSRAAAEDICRSLTRNAAECFVVETAMFTGGKPAPTPSAATTQAANATDSSLFDETPFIASPATPPALSLGETRLLDASSAGLLAGDAAPSALTAAMTGALIAADTAVDETSEASLAAAEEGLDSLTEESSDITANAEEESNGLLGDVVDFFAGSSEEESDPQALAVPETLPEMAESKTSEVAEAAAAAEQAAAQEEAARLAAAAEASFNAAQQKALATTTTTPVVEPVSAPKAPTSPSPALAPTRREIVMQPIKGAPAVTQSAASPAAAPAPVKTASNVIATGDLPWRKTRRTDAYTTELQREIVTQPLPRRKPASIATPAEAAANVGQIQVAEAIPVSESNFANDTAYVTGDSGSSASLSRRPFGGFPVAAQQAFVTAQWVQIRDFSSRAEAQDFSEDMIKAYATSSGETTRLRVRINAPINARKGEEISLYLGPLSNADSVAELCQIARDKGKDCSVQAEQQRSGFAESLNRYAERRASSGNSRASLYQRNQDASYTVQLGLYPSRGSAMQYWDATQQKSDLLEGYQPRISLTRGKNGASFYRLTTGLFANRSNARSFCASLQDDQIGCRVTLSRENSAE